MASTFVKDIMKTNVITIDESLTILDAAQMMTDAGVELRADVGRVVATPYRPNLSHRGPGSTRATLFGGWAACWWAGARPLLKGA